MGRSVHVKEHNFFIVKENISKLLQKILKNEHALAESGEIEEFNKLSVCEKLNQVIQNTWGFDFKIDQETGTICGISFIWEKMIGDEFDFMELMAEFVDDGCSITMASSGELWRYSFQNKKCIHLIPRIEWVENAKTQKKENKGLAKKAL